MLCVIDQSREIHHESGKDWADQHPGPEVMDLSWVDGRPIPVAVHPALR